MSEELICSEESHSFRIISAYIKAMIGFIICINSALITHKVNKSQKELKLRLLDYKERNRLNTVSKIFRTCLHILALLSLTACFSCMIFATKKGKCGPLTDDYNDPFINSSMSILFVVCALLLNITSIF